jgi:hypothetical protein
MDKPLPKWRLALYVTSIAVAFLFLSNADYNDQRAAECAERSNAQFIITHNPATDRCEKEKRNGTSTQNR